MNKVHKTFQTFMEDALQKSLPELSLVKSRAPLASRRVLSARLCFEGQDMKAQAFLSCTEDFLQMTCPLPRTNGEDHSEDVIKDWLGELGNLILGRLKNRLLAHDVTIRISAPDFAGHWPRPAKAETIAVWFAYEETLIGFDCAVEGLVPEIGEACPQSAEILPGDAIYRLNDNQQSPHSVDLLSQIRSGVDSSNGEMDEVDDEAESVVDYAPSPVRVAAKPFQIHFHNTKEPTPKAITTLISVAWPTLDSLQLKFSSGVEFTICPKTLLDQGTSNFEIEGNTLQILREGDILRISLPRLHLMMSKSLRLAG